MEGLIFGGAYLRREVLRFKIDWASRIVGGKFTVFASFYFVFEGNFPSTNPRGTYIWRGDLTEGFLRYRIGGLIFGGAYFRNFTVLTPRYYGLLVRECCKEVAKFGPKLVMLKRLLLGFCRSAFLVTWSKRLLVRAGLHAQRLVTAMRFDFLIRTN